jgi:hypothetical protein
MVFSCKKKKEKKIAEISRPIEMYVIEKSLVKNVLEWLLILAC